MVASDRAADERRRQEAREEEQQRQQLQRAVQSEQERAIRADASANSLLAKVRCRGPL